MSDIITLLTNEYIQNSDWYNEIIPFCVLDLLIILNDVYHNWNLSDVDY